MASAELLVLANMSILPSSEISVVRKEMQTLREQYSGESDEHSHSAAKSELLQEEIRVAERKAMLFRTRRLDEERIMSQDFSDAAAGMTYTER